MVQKLGLFGFVLALGAADGRKIGFVLGLFGFAFWAAERANIFVSCL
jgi:hypothetical protein